MSDSKSDQIIKLLAEGKTSREIIDIGFKPGTVFGTQRKWRKDKIQDPANNNCRTQSAPIGSNQSEVQSPEIESDPKLARLWKEIGRLGEEIDNLKNDLNKIPIKSIREQFICKCRAKGVVAIHFKCTQCGKEDWWGWWSKKA